MKKLLTAVALLAAVWLVPCAYFSASAPSLSFSAEELSRPPAPLPRGFLWGTATSAHQIEGGNHNDWSRFEEEPGRIARGERSGRAVDHWKRMAGDVALMSALHANAYRFSIEWSRVEPVEGQWSEDAWLGVAMNLADFEPASRWSLPDWLLSLGSAEAFTALAPPR